MKTADSQKPSKTEQNKFDKEASILGDLLYSWYAQGPVDTSIQPLLGWRDRNT